MGLIEFRLSINQEKVIVAVDPNINNQHWSLDIQCGTIHAELLRRRLQEELNRICSGMRQEAYLDGYKDGRAKRGKKTWFSGQFKI